MEIKNTIKSESGFSLVEVFVAAAVIGLVGYGMMTMVSNFARDSIRYASRQDLEEVQLAVQAILQDNTQCAYALRDATGNAKTIAFTGTTVNVDSIYSINTALVGKLFIKSLSPFSPRLMIGQITLEENQANLGRAVETINGVTYNTYLANVVINALYRSNNVALPPKRIPIKVYSNPASANKVQLCSTASVNTQSCITFGGTFDPATGICVLPPCPRATAPTLDVACPVTTGPQAWTGCGTPYYYWTFASGGTVGTQAPICVCKQICTTPPPPGLPPPPPATAVQPIYIY